LALALHKLIVWN